MKYLTSKETEDFEVNPTDVKEAEIQDADAFRHDMLLIFIQNEMGNIQFTPEFRDRAGRLSATVNFPYGHIFFFMERDQELVEYLRGKNLIRWVINQGLGESASLFPTLSKLTGNEQ